MTAHMLREEIQKTKALTDKPFGVNLMLMMTNIAELTEVIIEEKVGIVTTGAERQKRSCQFGRSWNYRDSRCPIRDDC